MTVIVTDHGFGPDTDTAWHDLSADTTIDNLPGIAHKAHAIRITFSSFADGRGFTLAAALRRAGFAGRLRAAGHVIADQYAMARRSGFDEVEISSELATRQPEQQWRARADWRRHSYHALFQNRRSSI